MKSVKLILASGSKNRQQALNIAKIPFTAIPSSINEKKITHPNIKKRIVLVAKAKVDKVAKNSRGLILGADGVNVCRGQVLEKPKDKKEAFDMLKLQSGRKCSFLTGHYLLNTKTGKQYQGVSQSFYTFRKLADSEIKSYIEQEPVEKWSAAFSPVNSMAITFIEKIDGDLSQLCFSMPFSQLIPIFKKEKLKF